MVLPHMRLVLSVLCPLQYGIFAGSTEPDPNTVDSPFNAVIYAGVQSLAIGSPGPADVEEVHVVNDK